MHGGGGLSRTSPYHPNHHKDEKLFGCSVTLYSVVRSSTAPVHWHVSTGFNTMQVLNVLCCCTAPPSCTFLEQCKQRVVGDGACWCISMDFVLGCMGCQITHFITWFTESFASSPMTLSGLDSCVGRCHVLTLSSATVKTEPHWWFHVEVGSYS